MKTFTIAAAASAFASLASAHATFQQLWINGVDQESTCARLPASNSPIGLVTSPDMRCNANPSAAASTCAVAAGDTVTVEMHQHNSRSCSEEAIGGAHHGPVMVYLSSVADAATADGSSSFFKIFESGYDEATGKWGNDILNDNCGKQDVVIPSDIAPGDYLLRAETIALHAAGSENGAQPYVTCYQITVSGSGTAKPEGVLFPGAYSASDPGLLINIYNGVSNYVIPGPAVYAAGGGSGSSPAPAPSSSAAAPSSSAAAPTSAAPAPTAAVPTTSAAPTTTLVTSTRAPSSSAAATVPTSSPAPPVDCAARRRKRAERRAARLAARAAAGY